VNRWARHHGLAGGGPTCPVGPRAVLLSHLSHTLGADAVFAALARTVAVHPAGGALLEWRGPSACGCGPVPSGRLRPAAPWAAAARVLPRVRSRQHVAWPTPHQV